MNPPCAWACRTRGWAGATRGARVRPEPCARPACDLDGFDDPRRPALGLSQQSFALLPKIAEVDTAMAPALQDPDGPGPLVIEVHPEVVFSDRNGGLPMPESEHAAEGLVRRRMLLEDALGRPLPVMIPRGARPRCRPTCRLIQGAAAIRVAVRRASAIRLSIGFTPLAVGIALESVRSGAAMGRAWRAPMARRWAFRRRMVSTAGYRHAAPPRMLPAHA